MESIYLNVNNKLKVLNILAGLSVSLVLLTIAVATYSITSPINTLLYLCGIYLGAFVLALWINAEAKTVCANVQLYLFEESNEIQMDTKLFITRHSPSLIGFFSILSILMYF